MQMKTGVEQSVYAMLLLTFLPEKGLLPGEFISQQLGASPTYFQKLLRKLVSADLLLSVPGVKGGFRLNQPSDRIRIFDVYEAIEGKQSLYASSGVFEDLMGIKEQNVRLLSNLMTEAEDAWQSTLKRETIGSLRQEIDRNCPPDHLTTLQALIEQQMIRN
ncbi:MULTISPECIES: Rrf2 family transcriptional regulator [unclassified Exiguobacterium]|uniref:Rrf2 family transcriptional regulator n=1 Tax=unclassified Exiguobacterium TaxID=2644629 RepID=UPI000B589C3B|nr:MULTISPECIES: Rrf2 family transcriptional regulator [unclassified Exiguobacterium]ASI34195.1 transcriptional regulator [Exiguobacterium sp. N4-1P]